MGTCCKDIIKDRNCFDPNVLIINTALFEFKLCLFDACLNNVQKS